MGAQCTPCASLPIHVTIRSRGWPRPPQNEGHRLGDGGWVSNTARSATAVTHTPTAMRGYKIAICNFTAVILNGSIPISHQEGGISAGNLNILQIPGIYNSKHH